MVFQVAPMVWVLINSFIDQDEGSLANFIEIFTNDFYLQAFQNTFWLALFSSVAGLLIATLTAFSLYRIQEGFASGLFRSLPWRAILAAFHWLLLLLLFSVLTVLLRCNSRLGGYR